MQGVHSAVSQKKTVLSWGSQKVGQLTPALLSDTRKAAPEHGTYCDVGSNSACRDAADGSGSNAGVGRAQLADPAVGLSEAQCTLVETPGSEHRAPTEEAAVRCSNAACRAPVSRAGYCVACAAEYRVKWEADNKAHRTAYWRARRKGLPVPRKKGDAASLSVALDDAQGDRVGNSAVALAVVRDDARGNK
jgi:hypothetical protein